MPKLVTPSAHIIADTAIWHKGLLEALGVLEAVNWQTDASSSAELLTEFAGRLCYRSFNTDVNLNVNRVREGNEAYLGNILKQKHGSVLEHAQTSVAFLNVSRVFTHELVRHRLGGMSQESMRYVRLDCLPYWVPDSVLKLPQSERDSIMSAMQLTFEGAEVQVKKLADTLNLDSPKANFETKKQWTSMLRRLVPHGVATHILYSTNHRAWRHIFQMRTAGGAEEEIKKVFGELVPKFIAEYPNLYQDFYDTDGEWKTPNGRI